MVTNTSKAQTGARVREAQCHLNWHRCKAGTVDGIFGNNTHSATVRFQKASKIGVDGIIGKQTWPRLRSGSPRC
jgi:peptidoglycan hydrolase-like protein with peptidoglycan-binding domain